MTHRRIILLKILVVSGGMTVNDWEWFEPEIMEELSGKK
jgi:hypothetical protein